MCLMAGYVWGMIPARGVTVKNGIANSICAEVAACMADDISMGNLMNSNHGRDVAIHALKCAECEQTITAFYDRTFSKDRMVGDRRE